MAAAVLGPGDLPPLTVDGLHLWRADLARFADGWSVLSDDETARAHRLHFAQDRNRFVAARSTLRHILGSYEGKAPESLRFEYAARGKPWLAGSDLRFSVTHAGDMALYALAIGVDVGVDIETVSTLLDSQSVVRKCMSNRERRLLDRIEVDSREHAVLVTWVRKEAVAKAHGAGLGLDLTWIRTRPGLPAKASKASMRSARREKWFVWDVAVGEDAAGAVAARKKGLEIRYFEYAPAVAGISTPWLLPEVGRRASLGT